MEGEEVAGTDNELGGENEMKGRMREWGKQRIRAEKAAKGS